MVVFGRIGVHSKAGTIAAFGWCGVTTVQRLDMSSPKTLTDRLSDAHVVSISDDSIYAMLDFGCTEAMGSRATVNHIIMVAVKNGDILWLMPF